MQAATHNQNVVRQLSITVIDIRLGNLCRCGQGKQHEAYTQQQPRGTTRLQHSESPLVLMCLCGLTIKSGWACVKTIGSRKYYSCNVLFTIVFGALFCRKSRIGTHLSYSRERG